MSAELDRKRPAVRTLRRMIRKELDRSIERLHMRSVPGATVHDVRKRLKRARAALRIVRKAVGRREYRRGDRALRDASRPLSAVRDARIRLERFDELARGTHASERSRLRPLRDFLVADEQRIRRRILGREGMARHIARRLQKVRTRMDDWPSGERGWPVIGSGLEHIYRSARHAFTIARKSPTAGNLHEWRKQTKYLMHALRFICPAAPAMLGRSERVVHELSDRLGEHHDLGVLRACLGQIPVGGHAEALSAFSERIDRRRAVLERQALNAGRRIFAQRADVFVRRLERAWRHWRSNGSATTVAPALLAPAQR